MYVGVTDYPSELPYLDVTTKDGKDYLNDMTWCQGYAFQNREFMLNCVIDIVKSVTGKEPIEKKRVNAHHNFCELTKCKYTDPKTQAVVEKELWVTRKGATAAREGQYGIIPGSMVRR